MLGFNAKIRSHYNRQLKQDKDISKIYNFIFEQGCGFADICTASYKCANVRNH